MKCRKRVLNWQTLQKPFDYHRLKNARRMLCPNRMLQVIEKMPLLLLFLFSSLPPMFTLTVVFLLCYCKILFTHARHFGACSLLLLLLYLFIAITSICLLFRLSLRRTVSLLLFSFRKRNYYLPSIIGHLISSIPKEKKKQKNNNQNPWSYLLPRSKFVQSDISKFTTRLE